MKKYLPLFLVFIVCFSSCRRKSDEVVAHDIKICQEINSKLKNYQSKTVDDVVSPAPGTITGYYHENIEQLKKISAEHFSDTNRVFTDYYFDDGLLIFIREQAFIYNRPNTYTEEVAKAKNDSVWYDDKKTRIETTRYYFDNPISLPSDLKHFAFTKNILVKWIKPDGTEVSPDSFEFEQKKGALWAFTAVAMKELKETPE